MGSPAENITRHYNGTWHGTWGAIPTPGHSKNDRGTTVKNGDDGGVVFNSFNGGDWRDLKEECERKGLLPSRPMANDNGGGWRQTGCYEYVGDDGDVVYRTVRQEKVGARKRFVAQHPDGRGGWGNGLGGATCVLYRLPDIKQAIARASIKDEPLPLIYLAEGERKADKLASWGFVATAVPFGAKGWRDGYAQVLSGCTVAILPDNDDEGRGFADRAAESIRKAGGTPLVVELPGLPPKGDVLDWAAAGGTAEELSRLTHAVLRPPVPTFEIANLSAWAQVAPEPKAFCMAGVIPEHEVTLFTGPGGTNKSTFGLQLCACSAAGKPMLGVDVQPGAALYVTAEDDDRENHWRLRKIAGAIGTTLEQLAGKLNVASLRGHLNNELATFDANGRLTPAPAFGLLRATIEATGSKLIVLDNVGHMFIGNENDRGQVTGFINLLYQLCRELSVTVVLIGHPNKAGDSYSGSTAWLNAVRSQIVLQRPEDGNDPDARVLTLGKANYARPDKQMLFRWHDFALVRDQDLRSDQQAEIAAIARDNADDQVFLRCLAERTRQKRAVSERTGRNLAPVVFTAMPEAKGVNKLRLERAMDRLFRTGRIERAELWKGDDRKPVFGLRETTSKGAGNAAGNGAETRCGNAGNVSAETQATHTLPLKGDVGAAFEGPAPTPDHDNHGDLTLVRDSRIDRISGWIVAEADPADEPWEGDV